MQSTKHDEQQAANAATTSLGGQDLARERQRASFDVRQLTYLLYGGEKNTKKLERIAKICEADPVFNKQDRPFLGRTEAYKRVLGKAVHGVKKCVEHGIFDDDAIYLFGAIGDQVPIALHSSMFIPTLQSQCSEEQKEKWLHAAITFQYIGCYAQTEMGHGSNVRGFETTATYDKNTQEFVLHSPTLTSTKWWPGGLGKTATHCVTHARLIIDGKDYGVHTFFTQIRSLEDHSPMPGITVGDIGPKFGYDSQDNGFLRFHQHRIPRENMLMRYAQVTPEGVYVPPKREHSKLGYGTMVRIRANIVSTSSDTLARALTIAIRYSAVRRQFSDYDGDAEKQVIDYQMQQYRLFPLLASAYAFHFTGKYMSDLYEALLQDLESADVSALPEVHATSSGLKAWITWLTSDALEDARKCCGGHGYSRFAGISDLFVNYVPACTYEGDNVVLCQQTARYLIKALLAARNGEKLVGSVTYLHNPGAGMSGAKLSSHTDLLNPEVQLQAYSNRARYYVLKTARKYFDLQSRGRTEKDAWNSVMAELVKMVKAHCFYTMVLHFVNGVKKVERPDLKNVLGTLSHLFALYWMEKDVGDFMETGFLDPTQADILHNAIVELLARIRPDAVALVDAWNYSDFSLNSSLGRYNGDCYEHMYEWAQKEPLNAHHQPPGYHEHLKPLLSGQVIEEALKTLATAKL